MCWFCWFSFVPAASKDSRIIPQPELGKPEVLATKMMEIFFPFNNSASYSKKKEASDARGRERPYSQGIPPAWIHPSVPRQSQWSGQPSFPGLAIKYKKPAFIQTDHLYFGNFHHTSFWSPTLLKVHSSMISNSYAGIAAAIKSSMLKN